MSRRAKLRSRCLPAPRKLDAPVAMFAYIQDSLNWREWRGRTLSLRKAQEMIAAGEAQPVTRKTENGLVTFYRETKPSRAEAPSPCALTAATMEAVSRRGDRGRLSRAEAAHIAKYMMWPMEHDRRNPATVVSGSLRDLQRAEAMLANARRVPKVGKQQGSGGVRAEFYPEPAVAA